MKSEILRFVVSIGLALIIALKIQNANQANAVAAEAVITEAEAVENDRVNDLNRVDESYTSTKPAMAIMLVIVVAMGLEFALIIKDIKSDE